MIFVLLLIYGCGGNDDNVRSSRSLLVRATIDLPCSNADPNFTDHEDNVYAYRADALFAIPAIQAGGHSTVDESTDLGLNLFFEFGNLSRMNYPIDDGNGIPGTSYVFYTIAGEQYISSANNTDMLVVEDLELAEDGSVISLVCTFNNIEVVNIYDPNDKFCINLFRLEFSN